MAIEYDPLINKNVVLMLSINFHLVTETESFSQYLHRRYIDEVQMFAKLTVMPYQPDIKDTTQMGLKPTIPSFGG